MSSIRSVQRRKPLTKKNTNVSYFCEKNVTNPKTFGKVLALIDGTETNILRKCGPVLEGWRPSRLSVILCKSWGF